MGIKRQTEEAFMQTVIGYAALHGWEHYHTNDSRKSEEGFPDLVFVRDGQLVFAELKLPGKTPTPKQSHWLGLLGSVALAAGGAVDVFLWTPADWSSIELVLGGKK